MKRLLLLAKIERGIARADRGETISHQTVKDRMVQWGGLGECQGA
jgi:predicted transcriptional regulator